MILFIHGTPSWSFDFRNVIKTLCPQFRCIAIDHIGFGLSDKPSDYDYSSQNHSRTLERVVIEKQLEQITLVVHDFGGPIGLHMAMVHPNLIKHIVVLNSWMWSSETDPDYIKLRRILKSPILPFLYLYLNFSPRFILPKSFGDHKLSSTLLKQYTRPFQSRSQRQGALAFARSLLHDQSWFESLWEQRQILATKPLLLIWGMKDPVIKPKYLDKFVAGFANAQIHKIVTSGHFPQEKDPVHVAEGIRQLMESDV